jgi:hypothetical protein
MAQQRNEDSNNARSMISSQLYKNNGWLPCESWAGKKKKKQGMIGGGVGAQLAIGGVALGCVIVEIEDDTVTEWSPSTSVCVCVLGRP